MIEKITYGSKWQGLEPDLSRQPSRVRKPPTEADTAARLAAGAQALRQPRAYKDTAAQRHLRPRAPRATALVERLQGVPAGTLTVASFFVRAVTTPPGATVTLPPKIFADG